MSRRKPGRLRTGNEIWLEFARLRTGLQTIYCVACEMRPKMAAAAVGDLLAAATAASSEPTSAATQSAPLDWPRTRCTSAGRGAKRQWRVEGMSGRATGVASMYCRSHASRDIATCVC